MAPETASNGGCSAPAPHSDSPQAQLCRSGGDRGVADSDTSINKCSYPGLRSTREYQVLDELRRDIPHQRGYDSGSEPTFRELAVEAEHQRGLFKVLALVGRRQVEKGGDMA
jgi:hypothetical protein